MECWLMRSRSLEGRCEALKAMNRPEFFERIFEGAKPGPSQTSKPSGIFLLCRLALEPVIHKKLSFICDLDHIFRYDRFIVIFPKGA
jgi:hypothetical protein